MVQGFTLTDQVSTILTCRMAGAMSRMIAVLTRKEEHMVPSGRIGYSFTNRKFRPSMKLPFMLITAGPKREGVQEGGSHGKNKGRMR